MNTKFDKDKYYRNLELVQQMKGEKEKEQAIYELNAPIPDSTPKGLTTKIKAFFIAALIIAVALIILAGSVVIIPTILVMIMFYLLFYAVKLSIK